MSYHSINNPKLLHCLIHTHTHMHNNYANNVFIAFRFLVKPKA